MALITRIKSWIDRECLTHTDLNAEFSNITDNIIASDLTNKGMIERATDAEVADGTDEERAVTPAGMLARTGTTARIGLVQLEDSHASVLTTKAPCSKNVKEAYDKAVGVIAEHSDITSSGANIEDAVTKKHAANADTSVGTQSADINMGTHKLTALSVPSAAGHSVRTTASITETALGDAVTKKHAANGDTALGAQSENLDMNTHKITGVVDPIANQEVATKKYVDDNIGGGGNVFGPATHLANYVPQWNGNPNSKTLIEGFAITAAGKAFLDDATAAAQRTTLGLGSAATRAAEDSMTDGSNLPDGHAIKTYGDANWAGAAGDKIIEGDTSVEVVDTGDGHIVFTEDGAEVARISGGSIKVSGTDTGYQFKEDAQGAYQFTSMVDGVTHYNDIAVDGIKIEAGGKTWGYLVNLNKTAVGAVPQLYFKDFPFGGGASFNRWGAPIFFDLHTTDGNNRAIGIGMSDTSTTGPLQATGIEIVIDTPPDRGGDTSGIYIQQSGGGNGMSVYKYSSSFPNDGFAIEAAADNGAHSIYTAAENGITLFSEMRGATGTGIYVFPSTNTSLDRRALKVVNAEKTVEKLYATLDGDIYTGGDIGIGIGSPADKLHIHDADSTIRFTTPVTGSTDSDGLLLGYQDETYNKPFIWNRENTDLEIATNNTARMAIKAGGDIDMKGNKIINVADPTSPQDAATKAYGDANWSSGGSHFVTPGAGTLSAAAAAASDGDVLWLKEGVYTETVPIAITSKSLSIIGAGPEVSIIRCTGTHGIVADTNSTVKHITLENFTIETTSAGTYTAIQLEGAATSSNVNKQFYIRNLNIVPDNIAADYWFKGIRLIQGWNTVIDGCHIRGKNNNLSMQTGIELSTKAIDVSITNTHFYFMADGITITAGNEGIMVSNSVFVYVSRGIYAPTSVLWLGVFNCHIAAFLNGINCHGINQSKIVGNLIYKREDSGSDFIGIQFATSGSHNTITSNTIRGQGTGGNENGIVLHSGLTRNIVSGNVIDGQDTGIWLQAGANYNVVDSNITSNCTDEITDSGTGNSVTDNLAT